MADRGKPLSWNLREQIGKLRRADEPLSYRAIAAVLGVSKNTVEKYANKFGTKSLPTTMATT